MSTAILEQTIGDLVTERPSRARVFETFGIDYCCGGKKPLAEACQARGIDPQTVLGVLRMLDEQRPEPERDWSQASMNELCAHIEQTHHAYLKQDLPRMEYLVKRVAERHGQHQPHLLELRDTFLAMKAELEDHMMKEERILFPLCRVLEQADALPPLHCGSVDNPIRQMVHEHNDAGAALAKMRQLTGGYTPPPEACNTYRAMYDALAELERDMHRHVHKENSILFPKAAAAEWNLRAKAERA
jgi:regulator of cell morphogenesis and NO signaling